MGTNIGGVAGGLPPIGYSVTFDPFYSSANLYQDGNTSLISSGIFPSTSEYAFQQIAISPSMVQWNFASSSSEYYGGVYSQLTAGLDFHGGASNPQGGHNPYVSNAYGGLFFSSSTGGYASTQYIYWLRVRALPPNGVMPAVSISGQTQKPTITLAVTVSGFYVSVEGSAQATVYGSTISA